MDEIRPTPADVVEKPKPDEHAEPGPPEVEAVPTVGTGVFRAELDSATGATAYVELTEDEVADAAMERAAIASVRADRAAAAAADVDAKAASRDADLAIVQEAAAKDPAWAAVLRLLAPSNEVVLAEPRVLPPIT
jgi:hypothetical protein